MMVKLRLEGRFVVVVGSSAEAIRRANSFGALGAKVLLVGTPDEGWSVLGSELCSPGLAYRYARRPRRRDLAKAMLVVATDRDLGINTWLSARAKRYGFLLNTLDVPEYCDYFHVAIRHPHPDIELGVSTDGRSPAFASSLATRLVTSVTAEDCSTYEVLRDIRRQLRHDGRSLGVVDWVQLERETRLHHA